ncbi:MAG: PadR family transcriptional regulator, partial [Conexivisphaera sp.]
DMIPMPRSYHRHGALRGLVLWVLSQSPANGAEIISTVEKMWWGLWRPSPGAVYPLLSSMAEEGVISRGPDGRYELTERGRRELEESYWVPQRKPMSVDVAIEELDGYVRYLEEVKGTGSLAGRGKRMAEIAERLRRLSEGV